jgi:hypothetical protein
MSKTCLTWLILVLGVKLGLAVPTDTIARIHFAGSTAISADPEFKPFYNVFCSTNAQALQAQTLDKLAGYPRVWLGNRVSAQLGSDVPVIRPLLDDFVHSEWYLQVHDSDGIAPEFALAIHLNDDRAKLWQNDLRLLLTDWTALPIKNLSGGWSLQKHEPPDSIRLLRVGEWVVLSCEQGKFPLADALVKQIKTTGRPVAAPKDFWLSLDADWSRLARYFPGLKPLGLPTTTVKVVGQGGNLCWDGKLINLIQPNSTFGPWQLPTNILHQPFISFTAVRGIGPWLQTQPWTRRFLFAPVPDQVYTWVMPGMPFLTFAAAPVLNSHATLLQLNDALSPANPNGSPNLFTFTPHTLLTNDQLTLEGFPFAAPFLQALHEPNGDFIFGGFFQNLAFAKPLPPELFARLATKNLVFYHWEITSQRLKSLPQLAQLMLVLSNHRQLGETSLANKWLNQIAPTLGSSMTMGIRTSPTEISFTRKAPGGLTAIELFALACWLEAPDFPGCNLKMPPPVRHPRTHPQTPNAPPPFQLQTH